MLFGWFLAQAHSCGTPVKAVYSVNDRRLYLRITDLTQATCSAHLRSYPLHCYLRSDLMMCAHK